ncbi:hypothetical protein GOBAR_AA13593 [Gossypium barbadense]|uniref:Sodium transporter HKT1 n=1 Tax=Gossypium barbadense TaxID=3634 RepID=A0A2P5XUS7_GOSBA|nr:hypothetical protein GOBAR_AA13593 [Gossypium barbadense]
MSNTIICFGRKLEHFSSTSRSKLSCFNQSYRGLISTCFRFLVFRVNPFWVQLAYFIVLSLVGFGALKMSKPKSGSVSPKNIDLFFTSVSATTVSSMSTVEMEVGRSSLPCLDFCWGGSGLKHLPSFDGDIVNSISNRGLQSDYSLTSKNIAQEVELGRITFSALANEKPINDLESNKNLTSDIKSLKYKATRCLGYLVFGYLLVVHAVGSSLVSMYVSLVSSARKTLKTKGIDIRTFSFFTVVSTFANCGFVPTNENMIVFKKNSGLLLLLIPQILIGNTLYPACLRALIWVLDKMTKKVEFSYILKNWKEMGYSHLLSSVHSCFLAATVFGLTLVQFILFCSMEWNSETMDGFSSYQKVVGSLFQVVNSRYAGESVVDLSTISSAILVLFVVMMYLPPYTSFLPTKYQKKEIEKGSQNESAGKSILDCVLFSQLSYLAIFIILICISERQKLKEDPLNFNVLNITIEVVNMSILRKSQHSIPLSPSYPPLLFHTLLFNPGPIDPTTPHRPTTTNGLIKPATVGYLLNKSARDGSFNTIKTFNFIINTEYSLSIFVPLSRLDKGLMRNHAFNLQIACLYKIERIEESSCVLDDDENGGLKATTFHHIVIMLTKKKKMDDGSDESRGVSLDVIT